MIKRSALYCLGRNLILGKDWGIDLADSALYLIAFIFLDTFYFEISYLSCVNLESTDSGHPEKTPFFCQLHSVTTQVADEIGVSCPTPKNRTIFVLYAFSVYLFYKSMAGVGKW